METRWSTKVSSFASVNIHNLHLLYYAILCIKGFSFCFLLFPSSRKMQRLTFLLSKTKICFCPTHSVLVFFFCVLCLLSPLLVVMPYATDLTCIVRFCVSFLWTFDTSASCCHLSCHFGASSCEPCGSYCLCFYLCLFCLRLLVLHAFAPCVSSVCSTPAGCSVSNVVILCFF